MSRVTEATSPSQPVASRRPGPRGDGSAAGLVTASPFPGTLTEVAQLEERYRPPHRMVLDKAIDHLDDGCRQFIVASTFVLVGTSGSDGRVDVSPRGGPAGFVKVLDDHRLVIPDLNGNNRLDSLRNIIEHPQAGLLFVIPGRGETLRVNGRAFVTTADEVLDRFVDELRRPVTAIGVEVRTAYVHCAKAFRRGGLWEPERWPDDRVTPSGASLLRDHIGLTDVSVEAIEADLEAGYRLGLAADAPEPPSAG